MIVEALTGKMDELMFRLQAKIVTETIPAMFKASSNISRTVRAEGAHVEGTRIVGGVTAGGPQTTKTTLKSGAEVDYAAVQEYGGTHGYEILPFNKKALAFVMGGKQAIFRRVFHPPLQARPFMRSSLQAMEAEIVEGLEKTFMDALNG